MLVEKNNRPKEVQRKLYHENGKRLITLAGWRLLPYNIKADGHERIKGCPNWPEQPVRRLKRRLLKRGIPMVDFRVCK